MGCRAFVCLAALALGLLAEACGGGNGASAQRSLGASSLPVLPASLKGRVWTDGSSELTGLLLTESERFREAHSGVEVVVGLSGETRGIERLCRGDVDIAVLRHSIPAAEVSLCAKQGVSVVRVSAPTDSLLVYTTAAALLRPEVRAFAEFVATSGNVTPVAGSPHLHKKAT